MRARTLSAAGLVLALVLAALSGSSSGASDRAGTAEADARSGQQGEGGEARVSAASAGDAPVLTMPLVPPAADVPLTDGFTADSRTRGIARRAPQPAPAPEPPASEPAPPAPEPAPPAPEPAPEPPPAAPGSVGEIIARHFGSAAGTATRVARCESGLNPAAVSPGGGNHGLFQINNVHRGTFEAVTGAPWSAVYDAELNTIFAKWLHDQQGWGPWACA